MKTRHPKKYTLIRRIYAWVGMITIMIFLPVAIAIAIQTIINSIT